METPFKCYLTYVLGKDYLQFQNLHVDINWLSCVDNPKQIIEALTMLKETIDDEVRNGRMSHNFIAGPMKIECIKIEKDEEKKIPGFCLPWPGIKHLNSNVGLDTITKILIGLKCNFKNLEIYKPKKTK